LIGKPNSSKWQLYLLGRGKRRHAAFHSLHPCAVSTISDVRESVSQAPSNSLWISYSCELTDELVRTATKRPTRLGAGVFLHSLETYAIPSLSSVFNRIAYSNNGGFLADKELAEVLAANNAGELLIGGVVDPGSETITFWRGNLEPLTVPFSAFQPSGTGTRPNFDDFEIIDTGQTVRLGDYEAAVDAILYEYDPLYRRELNARRRAEERTFGASLRRLRIQRGLRREDFEPEISAKTIARIEQGKVENIRPKTLATLAQRLNVAPEEIETY